MKKGGLELRLTLPDCLVGAEHEPIGEAGEHEMGILSNGQCEEVGAGSCKENTAVEYKNQFQPRGQT